MADIFEILGASNGKLDAKQVIYESLTQVLSQLYFYKEMLGERENEKELIESIRNNVTRIRWAVNDLLEIKK